VAQPLEEIGKLAMKLILDQIEGRADGAEPVIEVLKTQLVVRESSVKI
jgi:DNA-binding LacI/PurR family transcriptional regulator